MVSFFKNKAHIEVIKTSVWKFTKIKGKIKKKPTKYKVFPNPATEYFNIWSNNYSTPKNYRLVSIRNKVVARGVTTSGTHRVDVSNLEKGLYFLKVQKKTIRVRVK